MVSKCIVSLMNEIAFCYGFSEVNGPWNFASVTFTLVT